MCRHYTIGGGMVKPDKNFDPKSGASSGVTPGTLAEAKASGKIPGLDKVTSPKDMNSDQRAAVMQWYFDKNFRNVGGQKCSTGSATSKRQHRWPIPSIATAAPAAWNSFRKL